MAHIFGTRHRGGEHKRRLAFVLVCETEEHDVGVVVACEVESVFIGRYEQIVVGVDKLNVCSRRHLQARVPCDAQPLVGLVNVRQLVMICGKRHEYVCVGAIVDHNDLALFVRERKGHYAVETLFYHLGRFVMVGYDKAH